jgi:gamma-glutamyltranspeptidase / glutathione hydrolase
MRLDPASRHRLNYNCVMHSARGSALRVSGRQRCVALTFAVAALQAAFLAHALTPAPERVSGRTDKAPVTSRHDMVAAANPLAVEAGYRVLRQGGSAVDAVVAVQLVLNLVEPQSSGIGGGAFLLVHDGRQRRLLAYDGRETAPAAAMPERFLDREGKPLAFFDAVIGGRSVGVPGTLALLAEAHRRHGRLPWAGLFDSAIALAENGFVVSPRLASLIAAEGDFRQARAKAYFSDADGRPLAAGAVLRNPAFAGTLRKIAANGPDAFYHGELARDIVDTANSYAANPGDLSLADLAGYRIKLRAPVCAPYRAYRVCGMSLPSSGGTTVLQMLGMLDSYDLASMGPLSLWSVHFISEAGRLAFADREAYIADPDFVAPPPGLLDPAYLKERAQMIRTTGSIGVAKAGTPPMPAAARKAARGEHAALEFPSTSHISIVDRYGNAVAMTTTIEYAFGSHLMTAGGFLLNNELTDFSFAPTENGAPVANRVEPGKRPRSAMAPTIVYDRYGRVYMVVGSPGGSAIINYVVKTLVAVLDWNMDPQAAAALPNFGSRNAATELEQDTAAAALAPRLQALGHETRVMEHTSGVQAIVRTRTGWIGGADPRREGSVKGD